ncbi:hypothetical protein [Nocardia farcinica]|uniref:hypothetical protein n=1 Tax=Nocardia farcinica TaxID=37329 RepID=UPI002457665B|nr:hypothetical protein [Nocardia farcinica]
MARNPDNVKIWQDARVRASADATRPAIPTNITTPFEDADWPELGILDGDAGFAEDRSQDETEHFGWGIGLIKVGSKNFGLSRKMTLLEDNDETRAIVFPGSTATKIAMPKPVYRWLAFETDSDLGDGERLITTRPARLWVPANNRNESDITKWEVEIKLFADGSGHVFDRQAGDLTPTP